MGCGVACVASVLGESFGRTLRRFATNPKVRRGDPHRRGYGRRELLAVLSAAKKRYRLTLRVSEPKGLPTGTIIYCHGVLDGRGQELGHYLVRREGGWMDPLSPQALRRRLGKLRVVSALVPES